MFQVIPNTFCPATKHLLDFSLEHFEGLIPVLSLSVLQGPKLGTALQIQPCWAPTRGAVSLAGPVSCTLTNTVQTKPCKLKSLTLSVKVWQCLQKPTELPEQHLPGANDQHWRGLMIKRVKETFYLPGWYDLCLKKLEEFFPKASWTDKRTTVVQRKIK